MRRALLFLSLCALASCSRSESSSRQTIPFVREIISGEDSGVRELLGSNAVPSKSDAVFVIGESDECKVISSVLLEWDAHDNVDGRCLSDRLPDFAGEKIVTVSDVANTPYSGYLEWRNEAFLRELNVRSVLSALDSVCRLSPYDRDCAGFKRFPKLVVLSSSYAAEYGLFDIDSLFAACGCGIPVINPLDEMMRQAVDRNSSVVGIMTVTDKVSSGIYSSVFQRKAREKNIADPECVAFDAVNDSSSLLLMDWLDNYMAAGYDKPLDALLVDDPRVNAESLRFAIDFVRSVHNEVSLRYSRLFSDNFCLIDYREVTAEKCYRLLREHNLFTHDICYPSAEALLLVPSSGLPDGCCNTDGFFTDDFKYSRSDGTGSQSYVLIQYSERYLP